MLNARYHFSSGKAFGLHCQLSLRQLGKSLANEVDCLEDFVETDSRASIAVSVGFDDRCKIKLGISGIPCLTHILGDPARTEGGTGRPELIRFVFRQDPFPNSPELYRVVVQNGRFELQGLFLDFLQRIKNPLCRFGADIPPDAANLVHREDDPVPRSLFLEIHDPFADSPELHEQALEAERVGKQPQPEKMAVNPVHFGPDGPQVFRPGRYFQAHQRLDPLAVAEGVHATADPAHTLDDIYHLIVIAYLRELFQPAVNVTQLGNRLLYNFVLDRQGQMQRLRKNRMLRPER